MTCKAKQKWSWGWCSQREAKLRAMEAAAQADKEEDAAREKRLAALEAHIAEDAASDAERLQSAARGL